MKRLPCQYCAARGGKKHAVGCSRPQKVTQIMAKPQGHPTARPNAVLRNRIAIVIDHSGSMQPLRNDVPRVVNEQIREIKKNAAKLGQPTSLTLYRFADVVSTIGHWEDVFAYNESSFKIMFVSGQTALFDGVAQGIRGIQASMYINDMNTSFLVMTITDGEENQSRFYNQETLNALIRSVERTDRWTLVFNVPRGYTSKLTRFGISQGNIQEWDQTSQGVADMGFTTQIGLNNFYTSRSMGATKSTNFFQPDLTKVSTKAIQKLDDLSRDFHTWNVDSRMDIRDFVETKLANQPALARKVGNSYNVGRGYYQLTKSEEVQGGKDIVLLDKNTNALYGGDQARSLIGCPTNMAFKIKPGNHGNYDIFIKSTSVNRKLMPGTKVLYFVG